MLIKIMWNIVIEKIETRRKKRQDFHIAAFTSKGCTACIPTYLSPLKLESSACFWIKDIQICWLLISQKVMIVENYSKD